MEITEFLSQKGILKRSNIIGILENNENRCVGMRIVFVPPDSVGTVSSGRFSGNETRSPGATAVAKTRNIPGLFTVVQNEELLRSIWKYL